MSESIKLCGGFIEIYCTNRKNWELININNISNIELFTQSEKEMCRIDLYNSEDESFYVVQDHEVIRGALSQLVPIVRIEQETYDPDYDYDPNELYCLYPKTTPWYTYGKNHRNDEPAVIYHNSNEEWWTK